MVDEGEYAKDETSIKVEVEDVSRPSKNTRLCTCERCEQLLYRFRVETRFAGYSHINPLTHGELTDHQYFLITREVHCFVFRTRTWGKSHVVNTFSGSEAD